MHAACATLLRCCAVPKEDGPVPDARRTLRPCSRVAQAAARAAACSVYIPWQ